ncbi:unnamed protein product [Ectocarpus sp. 12 AP-2014]
MEATAVRKQTAAEPSAAASSQGAPRLVHPRPPPDTGDTAAAAGTVVNASCNPTTSPWKEYSNRIAGLCDDASSAAGPPAADLIRPPANLLDHPQRHRGPGSIANTAEPLAADRPAVGCGGVTSQSSDSNGAVPPRDGHDMDVPSKNKQVLILLDMNGTLLHRAKKPLRVSNDGGGGGGGDSTWGAPAFVHGENVPLNYYMRPGAVELVAALEAHPRARLAFYTSMRGVNALPAARFLMPDDSSSTAPEVYDRPFNARDPHGANAWDTTRDLPLIWSTPGRTGAGFGPGNSIMVDDTPRKMRFMDAGLVVVPEFTEACALEALGGETGNVESEEEAERREAAARAQREVLPRLLEYLSRLLDESGEDVRPFIERNPFRPRASSWLCTEKEKEQQDENVASPPARLSFLQAVELVLTTGPLSREWRDDDGRGGSPVVQGADASEEASPPGEGVAPPKAGRCEGGRSTFEGFGRNVEASVVASVLELLRRATAAAERWGLSQQERERLALWSRAAAATAS